ncbi:Uncharacterised protein [Vibrio cholerae]|nr:Uncharacterised protein [Vibrio cholerae]
MHLRHLFARAHDWVECMPRLLGQDGKLFSP